MTEITLAEAKQLCTAQELQLFKSSRGRELKQHSPRELKTRLDRGRRLRDKWRDTATRQRRSSQQRQKSRTTDDAARSQRKHQLFSEAVDRFAARLREVSDGAEQASPKRKVSGGINVSKSAKKKAATKKKAAKKSASDSTVRAAAAKVKQSVKKNVAPQRTVSTQQKPPEEAGLVHPRSKVEELDIRAEAHEALQQASQLTTRVRGHVSARDRRAQARRDRRQ